MRRSITFNALAALPPNRTSTVEILLAALRRFETSPKRLKCANSSHPRTARRTGQIDPTRKFLLLLATFTTFDLYRALRGLVGCLR
jgi:hypothetical protein